MNGKAATYKNHNVQNFIEMTVQHRWNIGLQMQKDELKTACLVEAIKEKETDKSWKNWFQTYGEGTRQTDKKLWIYLNQASKKIGFSIREK